MDQERDAICALKRGDIAGLEALVYLHQLGALRTAYRIVGDPQSAEDIVADAFLTVYERIDQYDQSRPFASWLYRVVVNRCLNVLRSDRRTVRGTEAAGALLTQSEPSPSPEATFMRRETDRVVHAALASLPPKQRTVVVLRYFLDMEEHDIAEAVGSPVGTVKWRLFAARRKVQERLAPHFEEGVEPPLQRRSI